MGFELGKQYECKDCGHISPLTIDFAGPDELQAARAELPHHSVTDENLSESIPHDILLEETEKTSMGIVKLFFSIIGLTLIIIGLAEFVFAKNSAAYQPIIAGVVIILLSGWKLKFDSLFR